MEPIKVKTAFIIINMLFLIDFSLTFIALNVRTGFTEYNPVADYFFHKGFVGWLLVFTYTPIVIYCFAKACNWIGHYQNKLDEKKGRQLGSGWFVSYIGVVGLATMQFWVIISNFLLLI